MVPTTTSLPFKALTTIVHPETATSSGIADDVVNIGNSTNTEALDASTVSADNSTLNSSRSRSSTPLPTYVQATLKSRKNRSRPSHPAVEDGFFYKYPCWWTSRQFQEVMRHWWPTALIIIFCFGICGIIFGAVAKHSKQSQEAMDADMKSLTTEKLVLNPDKVFRPGAKIWSVYRSPNEEEWSVSEGGPDLDNPLKVWEQSPEHWMVANKNDTQHDGSFIVALSPTRFEFFTYDSKMFQRPQPAGVGLYKDETGYWVKTRTLTIMVGSSTQNQDFSSKEAKGM